MWWLLLPTTSVLGPQTVTQKNMSLIRYPNTETVSTLVSNVATAAARAGVRWASRRAREGLADWATRSDDTRRKRKKTSKKEFRAASSRGTKKTMSKKSKTSKKKGAKMSGTDVRTGKKKVGARKGSRKQATPLGKRVKALEQKVKAGVSKHEHYQYLSEQVSANENTQAFSYLTSWNTDTISLALENLRMYELATGSVLTKDVKNVTQSSLFIKNYAKHMFRNNGKTALDLTVYSVTLKQALADDDQSGNPILKIDNILNQTFSGTVDSTTYGLTPSMANGFDEWFTIKKSQNYSMEPGDEVTVSDAQDFNLTQRELSNMEAFAAGKYTKLFLFTIRGKHGHGIALRTLLGPVACEVDMITKRKTTIYYDGIVSNDSKSYTSNFSLADNGELANPSVGEFTI